MFKGFGSSSSNESSVCFGSTESSGSSESRSSKFSKSIECFELSRISESLELSGSTGSAGFSRLSESRGSSDLLDFQNIMRLTSMLVFRIFRSSGPFGFVRLQGLASQLHNQCVSGCPGLSLLGVFGFLCILGLLSLLDL